MRKLLSAALVLSLTALLSAQNVELIKKYAQEAKVTPAAPIIMNEPATTTVSNDVNLSPKKVGSLTVVEATTMANAYGPASTNLHPLQYDPYANLLYIVNRAQATSSGGYGASSGEIWYSYSTDLGQTWTRVAAFNPGSTSSGRYPSAAFYNPGKSATAADAGILAVFPKTKPDPAWSTFAWGFDQGQAGSVLSGNIDSPGTGYIWDSQQPCMVSDKLETDGTAWVYWYSSKSPESSGDTASVKFWRTKDFSNIEKLEPEVWSSIHFNLNGQRSAGQKVVNGNIYVGFVAPFNKYYVDTTDLGGQKFTTIPSGWYVGYSKSEDNGNHWVAFNQGTKSVGEGWNVCDPRRIPMLSKFDRLWDWKKGDAYVSYAADMTVDKNGKVHFIIGLTDTIAATGAGLQGNIGVEAIAEVFETDNNGWDGRVIMEYSNNGQYDSYDTLVNFSYGGLDQQGYMPVAATDKDGEIIVATWVGKGVGTNNYNDIFMSYRKLTDNYWSTPVNLTESAEIHESSYHMAPVVKSLGNNQYQIFVVYQWPKDGAYASDADTKVTSLMVGNYVFTAAPTGTEDSKVKVNNFELMQNYPNPFNPTTRIQFVLPQSMNVTLKVYDVMGKEIATLLDGKANAGLNTVEFNASNLGSGVYFYKLNAGSYSSTKKMVLTK